ncbi:MAG: hypothetical protein HKUEN02_04730 [Anaerolineaceae bacterium]|nr:MAG: hypothetical protein HKUEN02_04730 [Anaerolineaceae bacterium]
MRGGARGEKKKKDEKIKSKWNFHNEICRCEEEWNDDEAISSYLWRLLRAKEHRPRNDINNCF